MRDKILELEGKKVEVTYRNALDINIKRAGNLVIEKDWAYLYDEGKTGIDYNATFCLKEGHVERVLDVTQL